MNKRCDTSRELLQEYADYHASMEEPGPGGRLPDLLVDFVVLRQFDPSLIAVARK